MFFYYQLLFTETVGLRIRFVRIRDKEKKKHFQTKTYKKIPSFKTKSRFASSKKKTKKTTTATATTTTTTSTTQNKAHFQFHVFRSLHVFDLSDDWFCEYFFVCLLFPFASQVFFLLDSRARFDRLALDLCLVPGSGIIGNVEFFG